MKSGYQMSDAAPLVVSAEARAAQFCDDKIAVQGQCSSRPMVGRTFP